MGEKPIPYFHLYPIQHRRTGKGREKVLIIGATGAMGSYLTEKLAADGVCVDAVSLDVPEFTPENVNRIQVADAHSPGFVYDITRKHYDAIVDFMVYNTLTFRNTFKKYLEATDQYVFLSSCRVYANEENVPGLYTKTETQKMCLRQIINKLQGEVWRGSALPLHFQSISAACTAKSRVFTKRSD